MGIAMGGGPNEPGSLSIKDERGYLSHGLFVHPDTKEPKIVLYNLPGQNKSVESRNRWGDSIERLTQL